jgi:hypothetical protein
MPKSELELVGRAYAPVAMRITLFYERFPEGRIVTDLVSRSEREVTFKAMAYRSAADREPAATGWASEIQGDGDINTVACLENTETSAIGRALANLGFTASANRPSAEEMVKAARARLGHVMGARPVDADASDSPVRSVGLVPRGDHPLRARARDPATVDVLDLLGEADRSGMDRGRVLRLRRRLEGGGVRPLSIERLERAIRRWLSARDDADRVPPSSRVPPRAGPRAV